VGVRACMCVCEREKWCFFIFVDVLNCVLQEIFETLSDIILLWHYTNFSAVPIFILYLFICMRIGKM
jgi:hypothetical protein